jgi:hypothetical protein
LSLLERQVQNRAVERLHARIMSVQDFIRTAAPPPDRLRKAWAGATRRGLAAMPPEEIEGEITAHRRGKKDSGVPEVK